MIKLKNGTEEQRVVVETVLNILQDMLATDALSFYDAVMLARNPDFPVWSPKILDQKRLTLEGKMHDTIRNIILNAVEGDELSLRVVSPYA